MSGQCCASAPFHLEKTSGSDSTGGWVGAENCATTRVPALDCQPVVSHHTDQTILNVLDTLFPFFIYDYRS